MYCPSAAHTTSCINVINRGKVKGNFIPQLIEVLDDPKTQMLSIVMEFFPHARFTVMFIFLYSAPTDFDNTVVAGTRER